MKKILFIITFLSATFSYTQEEIPITVTDEDGTIIESTDIDEEVEIIEVVADDEEMLFESTEIDETVYESSNVNSYNSNTNSVDIVTGEIDKTLLIFKGKNTNLYGLKDRNGKVLVKPVFYSIESYNSTKNRIVASLEYSKKGVIDNKGRIIIPFEYSYIYKNQDLYKCTKNGQTILFDDNGNSILKKSYEGIELYNDHIKVKENGLYGFLKFNGEKVLPIEYEEITHYEQKEWYLVVKNGVSNILNSNGKNIFGKKYTSLSKIDYNLNYLLAEKSGKFGVINVSGKEITPLIFETIEPNYDNTRFIVKQNGKWGVYDIYFKQFLIEPNYANIKKISNKYYLLSNANNKTIVNLLLNKKVDFSNYDNVKTYSYSSKELLTVEKNKLRGVFNMDLEKLIIQQKYNYIEISSYYIKCNIPNSRLSNIYDINGKILFKDVSFSKRLNNDYNYLRITSNGKIGVLYKDKAIINATYDDIKAYKKTPYVLVKSDNKNGLISLIDGEFLIPLNTNTITVNKDNKAINHKKKNYRVSHNKLVEIK